ncbi:hypothetical protein QFC24_006443 [Naganishia onofrii]|uniref:Uncharacterized protein n=1 Tax=Naganishia onofrii TaxID=1851511 RepID=A0ACC2X1Q4_9TREE|nr:hypothetical protein QFC24_006443 [Naganishia onofrii]
MSQNYSLEPLDNRWQPAVAYLLPLLEKCIRQIAFRGGPNGNQNMPAELVIKIRSRTTGCWRPIIMPAAAGLDAQSKSSLQMLVFSFLADFISISTPQDRVNLR